MKVFIMTEFTDKLTKDQAIDRQSELLERALQSINAMFIAISFDYEIDDHEGDDFPRDFMKSLPTHPVSEKVFQDLWNVREEICGNSAFMTVVDDE
jgi:hypothetical protein